jgi:phage portal protein BeeE
MFKKFLLFIRIQRQQSKSEAHSIRRRLHNQPNRQQSKV